MTKYVLVAIIIMVGCSSDNVSSVGGDGGGNSSKDSGSGATYSSCRDVNRPSCYTDQSCSAKHVLNTSCLTISPGVSCCGGTNLGQNCAFPYCDCDGDFVSNGCETYIGSTGSCPSSCP